MPVRNVTPAAPDSAPPFSASADATAYLREKIRAQQHLDEAIAIARLLPLAEFSAAARLRIATRSHSLVEAIRAIHAKSAGVEAFMHEYDLSTQEGVVLMCMAEALLRIPDSATVDLLIRDKIGASDWAQHIPRSDSLFVNASTWALMLTGRIINLDAHAAHTRHEPFSEVLQHMLARASEPVIRQAVLAAMRLLGQHFIMGRTITEALQHAQAAEQRGYRHSFDMLGEAARSQADAQKYFSAYSQAIDALGKANSHADVNSAAGISVKLSALHPRYEFSQSARVMCELLPILRELALQAKAAGIGFTIDAEETERLELSLDLIEPLALDPALAGWQGLGLALQAYQKRAPALLDWLADLARRSQRRLMVRLVKGAYWDSEIKLAQERGLDSYPVFTRKAATDVSYLACARLLLDNPQAFFPQFATHNAQTLASILEMTATCATPGDFEFQRLHGMGAELYEQIVGNGNGRYPCRVYAPVGSHADLLAYLVRRLLENGANSSFVYQLEDRQVPVDALIADPVNLWCGNAARHDGQATDQAASTHQLPLPRQLFGAERLNSRGLDLGDIDTLQHLKEALVASRRIQLRAAPTCVAQESLDNWQAVFAPANQKELLGVIANASASHIAMALDQAQAAFPAWEATSASLRAACLERAADAFEHRTAELMALIVREGGRTLPDALSEVREAIDFCRYYAARARTDFTAPHPLPGPTGERNELTLHGRGIFACISPWNFPLAIFIGQIAAALVAGNTVIAKPAAQTPLIAALAVDILHETGIPPAALQLLPGDGAVGAALVNDARIAGVAFTGSNASAQHIARSLVERVDPRRPFVPLTPLIAETGGQNVMIVDSSALPDQVVRDVLASAFNSAGQRCSALRVLFIQNDIADKVIGMLQGAMQELSIGDPAQLATDIGPLIDTAAQARLAAHVRILEDHGKLIQRCELPAECAGGWFFAPQAWEIDDMSLLTQEVFGPILHVIRWPAQQLDRVLAAIDACGYGLTLGIHSRLDSTIAHIVSKARVGNIYVNRNIIGAVVGVQPFGGERLSGTGPKAGGPHYLLRFASERCLSVNTTAAGGNASLMASSGK